MFLGAQLTVGLGVLLQLNTYSIMLGASSLVLVSTECSLPFRIDAETEGWDVPSHEASDPLAASISGSDLQLGCFAGLVCVAKLHHRSRPSEAI